MLKRGSGPTIRWIEPQSTFTHGIMSVVYNALVRLMNRFFSPGRTISSSGIRMTTFSEMMVTILGAVDADLTCIGASGSLGLAKGVKKVPGSWVTDKNGVIQSETYRKDDDTDLSPTDPTIRGHCMKENEWLQVDFQAAVEITDIVVQGI